MSSTPLYNAELADQIIKRQPQWPQDFMNIGTVLAIKREIGPTSITIGPVNVADIGVLFNIAVAWFVFLLVLAVLATPLGDPMIFGDLSVLGLAPFMILSFFAWYHVHFPIHRALTR